MKYDPSYNRAIWPESPGSTQDGMTLRDYFAAKAMQGMLAASENYQTHEMAMYAYDVADVMLAVREAK